MKTVLMKHEIKVKISMMYLVSFLVELEDLQSILMIMLLAWRQTNKTNCIILQSLAQILTPTKKLSSQKLRAKKWILQ